MSIPILTFLASLYPGDTGFQRAADGLKIKLNIPETEVLHAMPLAALHGVVFEVTIKVVKVKDDGETRTEENPDRYW